VSDHTRPVRTRPPHDEYFMQIALEVRERANCIGTRVGAVIALADRIVSTGYNGTPANMKNCDEGGCHRCSNRDRYPSGSAYDLCICVHAEQNALLSAARFGIPVEGATIYTSSRPCFGCTKELLQAGISAVFFLHDWQHPDPEVRHEYEKLQSRFPNGIRQVKIDDPHENWAIPKRSGKPDIDEDTGHTIPGEFVSDLHERAADLRRDAASDAAVDPPEQ
jgi:dCMP deaminase